MRIRNAIVVLSSLLAGVVGAKEQSKVSTTFENTGFEVTAAGTLKSAMKTTGAKFDCRLSGLTTGQTYRLVVGELPEAEFVTASSGKAKLKFQRKPGKPVTLDFDPRGKIITLNTGTNEVLRVLFSGEGEPAGTKAFEETVLYATALAPGGDGKTAFRSKGGEKEFKVEVEDTPAGDYQLFVDGLPRGGLTVGDAGNGEVKFSSTPVGDELLLDFDPRGKSLDVLQGTNVFFTGILLAQIPGVSACTTSAVQVALTSTGLDADASAHAETHVEDDCEREFEVEAEDLPEGDYDLFVGDVNRGTITVAAVTGGTEGRIEFSTDSGEEGKQLLTFDVAGQVIEIRQGTNVFFSAAFVGGIAPPPPACEELDNEVTLFNTGFEPEGKGKARFRQQSDCRQVFRVEVEDLSLGAFKVHVAGIERGTITVVDLAGEHVGEIEFDTDPGPNDVILDFDPRGQLIEVEKNDDIYLSRTFPE